MNELAVDQRRVERQFAEAVREVFGRPLRIQVTIGAGGEPAGAVPADAPVPPVPPVGAVPVGRGRG